MPISAPRPYSKPSAKRVDAFTITELESTSRRKRCACDQSSVTIASVCCEPYFAMCSIAASSPATVAMETLLVHAGIAARVLPPLCDIYLRKGVELRGDDRARLAVPAMRAATEDDWYTEYLAPILAVRVVDSLDDAMAHIAKYGSQHTDAIVTQDYANAMRFLREVDSASVMVNASTRFADGFEFGLGAEIGISTNKLHARGPVGLEGLTSQKFVVLGSGQVRT